MCVRQVMGMRRGRNPSHDGWRMGVGRMRCRRMSVRWVGGCGRIGSLLLICNPFRGSTMDCSDTAVDCVDSNAELFAWGFF